jgi:hypothetical protein
MQAADTTEAAALLQRAELLASAPCAEVDACDEVGWWPSGTTATILQADAGVLQAMMCMISGSSWAMWQCAYKLNRYAVLRLHPYPRETDQGHRTHRLCMRSYREVFGGGVPEGATVEEIVAHLDALADNTDALRHAPMRASSTLSTRLSLTRMLTKRSSRLMTRAHPAHWTRKPSINYVVAAAAYGKGIFDLIFSLLPPRVRCVRSISREAALTVSRKLTNLLYTPGDRRTALNLLHVAAEYGTSAHS